MRVENDSLSPDTEVFHSPIGSLLTESSSEVTVMVMIIGHQYYPSDDNGCNDWRLVELECNGTILLGNERNMSMVLYFVK